MIVFGFGWPADASKTIYDAIGASGPAGSHGWGHRTYPWL